MDMVLTPLHWIYLTFIVFMLVLLVKRRDIGAMCIAGIFILGLLATESLSQSVSGIFQSFIYATKELIGTIFIISIIVALSRVLIVTGINELMVTPLLRFLRTPAMAFWGIGIIMMISSFFFWPSPGVALVGAVLLPVALRAGLPALGAAVAMNLFGHGIALSGDYVIQAAPKLTADAAGIPVAEVMAASVPLVVIMGAVTTAAAYWLMRRDMSRGTWNDGVVSSEGGDGLGGRGMAEEKIVPIPERVKKMAAVLIPILFALDVAVMFAFKLQGGDATALIGGTATLILIGVTLLAHHHRGLEQTTTYLVTGFQFGFRIFGPVIPIAAFFYLGDAAFTELYGNALPEGSNGIVNDLGVALANTVPLNNAVAAATLTAVGAITGLDGSGFSGISLVGSIAAMFSAAVEGGVATLTALGQVAAIWVGGGTLIPWALIPAAAICGVSPFELARRNVKPVMIGLAVTTLAAMLLM